MKMMLTSAKLTRKKKKVSFHALIKLNTEQRRPVIMPFKYTDEKKFTVCLEGIFIWEENRNILLILS